MFGIGVLVIGIKGFVMYVIFALPNVGEAIEIQLEKSAEQIERVKFLANQVTVL